MPMFSAAGPSSVLLWGVVIAVALVSIFLTASVIRGRGARWIIVLLRSLLWFGALAVLARLSWVETQREAIRLPLAMVLDRSASMALPTEKGRSRWDEVKQVMAEPEFLQRLQKDFDLQFFSLAEKLTPVSRDSLLKSGIPAGEGTRIREGLEGLDPALPWAGIVLLSDGAETTPSTGVPRAPVVALYPTTHKAFVDAAILRAEAPEIAYLRTPISIDAEIEAKGVPREHLSVRLESRGRILAQSEIPVSSWVDARAKVHLSFVPEKVGPLPLSVEITRFPGEVTYQNNRRWLGLDILRDRVRVLFVAGRPSWDERFLRGYLHENPNIDLVSFFILRSPSDDPEAPQEALSLIPFPYDELFTRELKGFDLVIFQNFDYRTYFSPFYLQNLRSYVENGGSFLAIGGDRAFGKGGYRGTPLEEILPVRLRDDRDEISVAVIRVRMASGGARHPILSGDVSASVISSLPPIWGFHRTAGLEVDAVSLLETGDRDASPIVAVRNVGQGRSAAILTDSLWRWAFSADVATTRVYRALFDGLYRWMVDDPSFAHIQVKAPSKVSLKEPFSVQVVLTKSDYTPFPGVTAVLSPPEIRLGPTGVEGTAIGSVTAEAEGMLLLRAVVPKWESQGYAAETLVRVGEISEELLRRDLDVPFLERLASETEGSVGPISAWKDLSFSPIYRRVTYRTTGRAAHPLWDRSSLLILLLVAAIIDFALRRRQGAA